MQILTDNINHDLPCCPQNKLGQSPNIIRNILTCISSSNSSTYIHGTKVLIPAKSNSICSKLNEKTDLSRV